MLVLSRTMPRERNPEEALIRIDYTMLAKTVPEPSKDGRVFVCSAGHSEAFNGLIRLYPLSMRQAPATWSRCLVEIERNHKDNREASWKIAGDRSPGHHPSINQNFNLIGSVSKSERGEILKRYLVSGLKKLNASRKSLGVLVPQDPRLYLSLNPGSPDSPQLRLFAESEEEGRLLGSRRFPYIPRVRFSDEDGDPHDLQLREWGVYEYMRKNLDLSHLELHEKLSKALRLDTSLFLVGNLCHQRTVWIIAASFARMKDAQLGLFQEAAS